jgi:hypothetical protein
MRTAGGRQQPTQDTRRVKPFAQIQHRDRILGRNWDKSLKRIPPCYSQSPLLTDFTPLSFGKSGLKLVCNVNIVYGNLKYENTQDYAQKPQRNCTFMNSASAERMGGYCTGGQMR